MEYLCDGGEYRDLPGVAIQFPLASLPPEVLEADDWDHESDDSLVIRPIAPDSPLLHRLFERR